MKKNLLILGVYILVTAIVSQLFAGHELLKSFLFLGSFLIIPWHFRQDKFILFSLLAGLVVAFVISYWAPYPYIYDTDVFRHVFFINEILNGTFFWGQSAYLGVLHNIVALASLVFNFKEYPYVIFWSIRFIVFPLYSLGIFLFIRQVTKHNYLALFSAVLAPLTIIEYLSLINFAPKIISLILLPYFLFWCAKSKKINWKIIIIISVLSLAAHFYMGLVNLFVIFSWLFFKKFSGKYIYVFVALPLLFIFLQAIGLIDLSQKALSIFGEADLSQYNFSFYLQRFSEYFPIAICAIALLGLILRRADKNIAAYFPAIFIIIGVYFSPLNASYRVLASLTPLVILAVCLFILDFSLLLQKQKIKVIFYSIICLILLTNFCLPYYAVIKKAIRLPNNEGHLTILTPQEYTTANWLRSQGIAKQIIISDPVNSLALASLSNNNWLLTPQEIVTKIMKEEDAQKTYDFIKNQEVTTGKKILIYLDGRTSFWVRESQDQQVLLAPNQSKNFKKFSGFEKFFNKNYFRIVYQSNEPVYLIEVL